MLILLLACNDPGPAPAANADQGDWPELPALDDEILAIMEEDRVPGLAACIARDGELAWCQGYGWADLDAERPVTPDTGFLLASVSKAVVGVALMQAAEQADLDLDADVGEVLPFEVRHPDYPSQQITPRRLATHTAGIADNWDVMDSLYVYGEDSPLALGEFMEGYLVEGGDWYDDYWNWTEDGPGGAAEYSNIGSALAAHVVEEATGTAFDRWCEEQIFAPLDMSGTSWMLADLDRQDLALPYEWVSGGYLTDGHYGFPDYPSGQLRSSATAMSRLLLAVAQGGALDGERVLASASVQEMLSVPFDDLDPDQGVFWYRWELDGEEVWGHNGGEVGAATEILLTEDGTGLVVLMNAEGEDYTLEDVELAMLDAASRL